MPITGKRFLITGGASLIGSHVARALLDAGAHEVVLYDNLSLGPASLLEAHRDDPRVRAIRGDILRLPQLLDAADGVDGIFALAGYLTLPFSERPAVGADVNVMGQINTLEAARRAGPCRVVFASSVAVYGGDVDGLVEEARGFRADNISAAAASYGASKLLGESLGRLYAQRHGADFCALRFSTVYGEQQHMRGVNALYILEAMQAIRAGRPIVIPGSGSEAHDYVYVGDVASACVQAMDRTGAAGPFNIASGQSTSVNAVVSLVLEEYGSNATPEHVADARAVRSTSHHELRISIARAKEQLGWQPAVPLRQGIARLRRWLDSR
jgi:UDP-glucose 4-epimerase